MSSTSSSHNAQRMSHMARPSMLPGASASSASAVKNRHLSHLHSQLAQLSANLSDLENLIKMTAVQAESMRGLGGWCGGLFMAASKVLGEETIAQSSANAAAAAAATAADQPGGGNTQESDTE